MVLVDMTSSAQNTYPTIYSFDQAKEILEDNLRATFGQISFTTRTIENAMRSEKRSLFWLLDFCFDLARK